MEVMFDRVAGLDVGKESVTVCLRTPGLRGRRHAEMGRPALSGRLNCVISCCELLV